MKTLVEMKLMIEKEYYEDLLWLCSQISENRPEDIAEALLQVAIENTVDSPEAMEEWIKAFPLE